MTADADAADSAPSGAQRVRLVLLALTALAGALLPLLTVAPNRLVTGVGVSLYRVVGAAPLATQVTLAAALLTMIACTLPLPLAGSSRSRRPSSSPPSSSPSALASPSSRSTPSRRSWRSWQPTPSSGSDAMTVLAAGVWLNGLVWLVGLPWPARPGAAADVLAADPLTASFARTALGGGFWALALLGWLTAADAARRLGMGSTARAAVALGVLAPACMLVHLGHLDGLSLLKEYDARSEVFQGALWRHLALVGGTLAATVLIGWPLGVAIAARHAWRAPVFAVLNVVQTVPSIALFGLLMTPLGALAAHVPALAALGIRGIGVTPAVIALVLYALLPVARSVVAGLDGVPAAVIDAARGMGMRPAQVFVRVALPLALPVLLQGLRVTAVQTLGLAVVAALIGAGGFGALVFQGVSSSAVDLVMLGVIPVVALSMLADALFRILAAACAADGSAPGADDTAAGGRAAA